MSSINITHEIENKLFNTRDLLVELLEANDAVVRAYGDSSARNIAIARQEAVENKAKKYLKIS